MSENFPKSARLRKRRDYLKMTRGAKRWYGQWIIIDCKSNTLGETRLGVTCTRRYGRAHQRNRFKRIVREAFRQNRQYLRPGFDILVKPRSAAMHATTQDIINELKAHDNDSTTSNRSPQSRTEASGSDG